jgi:hypothetical protein
MCSSPKTQQAQQPKQNQFANSNLSSSQMASFAAVANAAQARREQREKRKNAHPTSTNVAEVRTQAQKRGGESYFATLLRKWLKKAHLA